jgi:hypothetical protein
MAILRFLPNIIMGRNIVVAVIKYMKVSSLENL